MLAGGELAAMVVCDTVLRKLPGALGHADSAVEESFWRRSRGTRSTRTTRARASWRGWARSRVLLSGHHERIREWRREQSREPASRYSRRSAAATRAANPA